MPGGQKKKGKKAATSSKPPTVDDSSAISKNSGGDVNTNSIKGKNVKDGIFPPNVESQAVSDSVSDEASSVGQSESPLNDTLDSSDVASVSSVVATDGGSVWSRELDLGSEGFNSSENGISGGGEKAVGKNGHTARKEGSTVARGEDGLNGLTGSDSRSENGSECAVTPEVVALRSELETFKDKNAGLQVYVRKLEEREKENVERKKHLTELKAEIQKFQEKYEELEKEADHMGKVVEEERQKRRLAEEANARNEEAERKLKEVEEREVELEAELKIAREGKEMVDKEIQEIKEKSNIAAVEELENMKNLVLELSKTAESELNEIQLLKGKLFEAESNAEKMEKKKEEAVDELKRMTEDEGKKQESAEKVISEVELNLANLREEKSKMEELYSNAIRKAEVAEREGEERYREIQEKVAKSEKIEHELRSKVKVLEESNESLEKVKNELLTWKRGAEKKAADEFEVRRTLEKNQSIAVREVEERREREKGLEEELLGAKEKAQKFENELQKMEVEGRSSEVERERIGVLEKRITELISAEELARNRFEDMRREKERVDIELKRAAEMEKQAEAISSQETKGLKAKLSTIEKENSKLSSLVKKQESDLTSLLHKMGSMSQELEGMAQERARLQDSNDELKAKHRGIDSTLMSAVADAEMLRMEHQMLKQQLHSSWTRWGAVAVVATGTAAAAAFMMRSQGRRLGG